MKTKILDYLTYILFIILIVGNIWQHDIEPSFALTIGLIYASLYHKERNKPKTTNINAKQVDIHIDEI